MTELFLRVVNLSIAASWLVLAVLLLRLILRRSPKWISMLLWGLVGVRLVCPFSLESVWSLIPSAQTISPTILTDSTPTVHTGFPTLNQSINPVLSQAVSSAPDAAPNLLEIWLPVLAVLWVMGVAVGLGYAVLGYVRLRRDLETAVWLEDNLYQSGAVRSPFVLGLRHPRIYLPFSLDGDTLAHVVAHERTHLARRDHWWKALGFVLLCVHWFNPLMWVAYGMFCRDVELACDEAVVKNLEPKQRADYSQALLLCSVGHTAWTASPLCFGEVSVKQRVKAVLRYRRPTLVAVSASVLVCVLVGVAFLTNPLASRSLPMSGDRIADLDPQWMVDEIAAMEGLHDGSALQVSTTSFEFFLTPEFEIRKSAVIPFFYVQDQEIYDAQLKLSADEGTYSVTTPSPGPWKDRFYNLYIYLQALKHLPQEEIRHLSPDADLYCVTLVDSAAANSDERSVSYTDHGVQTLDGWYIHLQVQPFYEKEDSGYHGTGEDVIDLFYGDESRTTQGSYVGTDTPGTLAANASPSGLDSPYLHLGSDGTFWWSYSMASSFATTGLYEETEDTLTLYTNQGRYAYVFRKEGDTLVYAPDASTHHLPLEDWAYLP